MYSSRLDFDPDPMEVWGEAAKGRNSTWMGGLCSNERGELAIS